VRDITRQKELELHLKALSVTDELTQVYNRRFFISALTNELSRFERQGAPFCVCVIDFDYFKMINDRYGHQAGDLVLVEISRIIGQRLRKTDLFARLGGEEFAVLMPDTRLNEAKVVAENITKRVRDARVKTPTNDIDITVTIGIAQVQRGSTWMDVLKQADDALYQGKRNGRDTIEVST
jgi:diguanylate cyclase (GGDEF)-like protein